MLSFLMGGFTPWGDPLDAAAGLFGGGGTPPAMTPPPGAGGGVGGLLRDAGYLMVCGWTAVVMIL